MKTIKLFLSESENGETFVVKVEKSFLGIKFKREIRKFYATYIGAPVSQNDLIIKTSSRQYPDGFILQPSGEVSKKIQPSNKYWNKRSVLREITKEFMLNFPESENSLRREEQNLIQQETETLKKIQEERNFSVVIPIENNKKGRLTLK